MKGLFTLAVTPTTTGDPLRDTSTSFFLALLDTVLDNAWLVSNFGVITGVLPLLGGALVLAGVVISFLALLPFLVLAGVSTLEESEGVFLEFLLEDLGFLVLLEDLVAMGGGLFSSLAVFLPLLLLVELLMTGLILDICVSTVAHNESSKQEEIASLRARGFCPLSTAC